MLLQCCTAGCSGSCSDELPEVIAKMGFKGVHTLPRRLRFDQATKTLRAYPVEEISQLRGAQVGAGMPLVFAQPGRQSVALLNEPASLLW